MRQLGLDQPLPQGQALQGQILNMSTEEMESAIYRIGGHFHFASGATDQVAEVYQREIAAGAVELNLEEALSGRERLTIGLVSLVMRECELIPEYDNGLASIRNLDVMMRNITDMINVARTEGRLGHKRVSRRILAKHVGYRFAVWLHRVMHIDCLPADVLANRPELLIYHQAVFGHLCAYNRAPLQPVLGEHMVDVLDGVLIVRIEAAGEGLAELRERLGDYNATLGKCLLVLFALYISQNRIDTMLAEMATSKEVYKQISAIIHRIQTATLSRPLLPTT